MTATEYVILVDENDTPLGAAPKLYAHQQGLLHRAFSVFIYRINKKSKQPGIEWLLQQRAHHKYHSPGLWTNTCCSHPRPDEKTQDAATRRLQEEMGFGVPLTACGLFQYKAAFDNDLIEHEIDHVFAGAFEENSRIAANPEEVASHRWITTEALQQELVSQPAAFTPWFQQAWDMVREHLSTLMTIAKE